VSIGQQRSRKRKNREGGISCGCPDRKNPSEKDSFIEVGRPKPLLLRAESRYVEKGKKSRVGRGQKRRGMNVYIMAVILVNKTKLKLGRKSDRGKKGRHSRLLQTRDPGIHEDDAHSP